MPKNYVLFNRYIRLVVGPVDVSSLHASFTIEKNLAKEPNKAEILLYNLNPFKRKTFDNLDGTKVEIHTGYSGFDSPDTSSINLASPQPLAPNDTESLLFKGDITQIFSTKSGPDWITVFRTADGIDAKQKSRINKSYKKSAVYKTIALDLIKAYQIDNKKAISKISGGDFKYGLSTVLNNFTLSGKVNQELDKLLDKFGLTGSIQDGELILLKEKETLGTDTIVLTPETGLIGSPELMNTGYLKCKTLIRPEIKPGYQLNVQSDAINGLYRIERVVYTGSTFETTWYCDIEAKPI